VVLLCTALASPCLHVGSSAKTTQQKIEIMQWIMQHAQAFYKLIFALYTYIRTHVVYMCSSMI